MDFNKIYLLDKPGQFQHSNVERKSHVARGYIYIYIYTHTDIHTLTKFMWSLKPQNKLMLFRDTYIWGQEEKGTTEDEIAGWHGFG